MVQEMVDILLLGRFNSRPSYVSSQESNGGILFTRLLWDYTLRSVTVTGNVMGVDLDLVSYSLLFFNFG